MRAVCPLSIDSPRAKLEVALKPVGDNTISLRERISNASDELNRIRHESTIGPVKIEVRPNSSSKALDKTIFGLDLFSVGTEQGLAGRQRQAALPGEAADASPKPGYLVSDKAMVAGGNISTIGQFDVGCCSAYLASDKVRAVNDVVDKVRYESTSNTEKIGAQPNTLIKIVPDRTKSTPTMDGSGTGMMKNEIVRA